MCPRLVTPAEVRAAELLVQKMTYKKPYSVEYYPNPTIQKHYRAVEAMALDLPEVEEFKDVTGEAVSAIVEKLTSMRVRKPICMYWRNLMLKLWAYQIK